MGLTGWVLSVGVGAVVGWLVATLSGLAKSSRSMLLTTAGGVLGSLLGALLLGFRPWLWGWPVLPSLIGGYVVALVVALMRRAAIGSER